MKNKSNASLTSDLGNVVRGLLMGSADIVPGVSGGTVALILGIYQRLVAAISRLDIMLIGHLRHGRWSEATGHVDLRFLVALGTGILTGIVALASVMNYLLTQEQTRPLTLAAFFGLILASSVLVARMIEVRKLHQVVLPLALGVLGACFAFWLTGLRGMTTQISYLYVFGCGALAICAMILPGISGAFIMLILGIYVPITGILRRLPRGDCTLQELLMLATFATGCAVGIVSFSKILRLLLARWEAPTMAVLAGFMIGSLRKIWPYKVDVTLANLDGVGLSEEKIGQVRDNPELVKTLQLSHRMFENVLPDSLTSDVLITVAIAVVALLSVFALDWFVRRRVARKMQRKTPEAK